MSYFIWFKTNEGRKDSIEIDKYYSEVLIEFEKYVGDDFSKIIEVEVCTTRDYISQAVDLEFKIIHKAKEMRK